MNDEKTIKFIIARLERHCDAVTTNMVTTLMKKWIDEIGQLQSQLINCQGKCRKSKRELYRGTGIIL